MTSVLDALIGHMKRQDIARGPTVTAREIAAFESRHDVRLPEDVRAYFIHLNGCEFGHDGPWDDQLLSFWHLSQLRPLSVEFPQHSIRDGERFFAFADYSIDVHCYAIRLSADNSDSTPVAVLYDEFLVTVAPSLTAFFERYLVGDQEVLFPDPPAEWHHKHGR